MAESVKNNARRRKPPSHLMNDIYSPDQLDSSLNPNLLTKVDYFVMQDAGKYASDPYSQTAYARILVKFINKTNKCKLSITLSHERIQSRQRSDRSQQARRTYSRQTPTTLDQARSF